MKKKSTIQKKTKSTVVSDKAAKSALPKTAAVKKSTETPLQASPEKVTKKKLPMPSVTTIIATADIGWGNQLYLRGEGGGLSWETGIPMTCNGAEEWVWVTTSNDPVFQFKFVLNDKFWSLGENVVVTRGGTSRTYPAF